jgi:uncharacterized protein (DUF58 family)
MITQRAWLVGIVGLCFYLIALVNALPTYFNVLTWLSVSVLVSSVGVALLSLQGLDCTWRVTHTTVTESLDGAGENDDDPPPASLPPPAAAPPDDKKSVGPSELNCRSGPLVEVRLTNSGTLNKTGVLLDVVLERRRTEQRLRRRFLIEALPSGMTITTALSLNHLPRGRYRFVEMRLIGSDVLGLFRAHRRVSREQGSEHSPELIVGPATVNLHEAGSDAEMGDVGGARAASILLGHSDEIRGIRPYAAGDDLRRVHWKSTARLGRLVVKEFDYAARPDSVVIWDGTQSPPPEEVQPNSTAEEATEYGLRLAASLCRSFLERGRPCALLRLDSEPLSIFQGNRSVHSTALLGRCMEALADADAERTTALMEALGPHLRNFAPGSEVFLVTAMPSPALVQAVTTLRSRGLQVRIGLVRTWHDNAASAAHRSQWPRRGEKPKARGVSGTARDAALYSHQVRLLRESGVPVSTLIPPPTPARGEAEAVLRATLQSLLGEAATARSDPLPASDAVRRVPFPGTGERQHDISRSGKP